ncbi:unnamed protein product [Rhizopus stolonifer]
MNVEHNQEVPRAVLLTVISGIREMIKMTQEESIESDLEQIEKRIQVDNMYKAVYDTVNDMKQIMNNCACEYYKTVEKSIIVPFPGYKIEEITSLDFISDEIEHMDRDGWWYRDYFRNNPSTCHFLGYKKNTPLLISAVVEKVNNKKQYRMIYRRQKRKVERKIIPDSFLLNAPPCPDCDTLNDIPDTTWKTVIETNFDIPFHLFRKMTDDVLINNNLDQELQKADECALRTEYKFGVFLVKNGQTREEEWLSNEHDSPAFIEFLDIIGHLQSLEDYDGFTGRLGAECEFTYVNTWHGNAIAYHVSTLIPSNPGDQQQVARKKYIGNDIVCIVFIDGDQPFNPADIVSQMQHIFIVVRQEGTDKKIWRVQVVTTEDVPSFGPPLPELFENADQLSRFILVKLINAEYAGLKTSKFIHMSKAGDQLLPDIVERGWKILDEMERTCSDACSTSSGSNCSCSSLSGKKRSHIKAASSISSFSTHSIKSSTITASESMKPSSSKSSNFCLEKSENKETKKADSQQSLKQRFFTLPSLRKNTKE